MPPPKYTLASSVQTRVKNVIKNGSCTSPQKTPSRKAELGTRYLKSSGAAAIKQKSSGAAAYRYSNKKVAPLPLLACKTAAAAATLKK